MSIRGVEAQCVTNKVVFADRFTLEFDKYVLQKKYSVPGVTSGESFVADCNFAWSMLMNAADGYFIFGGASPGFKSPGQQLGIPFRLKDGLPSPVAGSRGEAMAVDSDFAGYTAYPTTGIDASFLVFYAWPWSWVRQERIFHVIASQGGGREEIRWRSAPRSEPIIPDGAQPNGFKVTAKGDGEGYGITLGRPN